MYSVGLLSGKSLFQLQAERLLKLKSMAAAISVSPSSSPSKSPRASNNPSLPWYIMVSERTLESTQSFFDRNGYFGLDRSDVMFFEQSTMPCFFKDGRIILDGKSTVSRSPDGNGGLYKAIRDKGVLDDLIARGVKYVHVYCVDNILVKVADPVFTGFSIIKQLNCGSKVSQ
jgi:UDP-N-acetylglucosamine/UDP-N-acetylgalactosamine diphosphorylase